METYVLPNKWSPLTSKLNRNGRGSALLGLIFPPGFCFRQMATFRAADNREASKGGQALPAHMAAHEDPRGLKPTLRFLEKLGLQIQIGTFSQGCASPFLYRRDRACRSEAFLGSDTSRTPLQASALWFSDNL